MTARQLWRPPVGIPTRVIQVPWGRRLCDIELVCIKLGESITSWAEKFFQKTCPSRPSRPRQSWTERGPALRSGALSRNQSCPLSAPCAPVEAVSSTSCIPLRSLRAVNCCAIIVRAVVRVKRWCAYGRAFPKSICSNPMVIGRTHSSSRIGLADHISGGLSLAVSVTLERPCPRLEPVPD